MPEELASQIAAGEVVERPASVIKELIENALDAGADSIEVDISLKRRRLRVKDNGFGIPAGQVELAVARHGTSKVADRDDIFGIASYGFRGEALPSIASVSRLTLTTRSKGEKRGSLLKVEGGSIHPRTDGPAADGTEVLVENLFYNTPARRKFLRSDQTETTHITSTVVQTALAVPQVRFTYTRDKKRVMQLPPAADLAERVRQIFGSDYAERLVEVDYKEGDIRITGLAGKPDFNRATAIDQYFFVNNRPVKDALIRAAVARAFEDLVPRGRKPVVFLKMEMPFTAVDVNVHPAKAEVRFSDPGAMRGVIVAAVRRSLGRYALSIGAGPGSGSGFAQERPAFNYPSGGSGGGGTGYMPPRESDGFARSFELWSNPMRQADPADNSLPVQPSLGAAHGVVGDAARAVGQLFKTFIVIEDGDRMVVMDQHTVHERILYERILKRLSDKPLERQKLLLPETVTAPGGRAELIRSYRKTLEGLGWVIEDYGEESFAIREVPSLLGNKNYQAVINELAETIEGNRDNDFKAMTEELVSRMACRAAVKAGDDLTREEMMDLVEELGRAELPYTCPHGRPVALELTRDQLSKNFLRPS